MARDFLLAAVAALAVSAGAAQATPYYLTSSNGQPWVSSSNIDAMNDVFGAGAWTEGAFETVDVTAMLGAAEFVYIDGSDVNADELENFLAAYSGQLLNYVNAGGSVLINAAPNEGDGMSFLLGASLVYGADFCDSACEATDPAHPIFNGPFSPNASSFSGNSFSHGYVTGADSALIVDGANGQVLLGQTFSGLGLAMFGSMTTANFHDPDPEAGNLLRNILAYGADAGAWVAPEGGGSVVPVPAALPLLGTALLAIGWVGSRRRPA
jgi:hypothetical protein